MHYERPIKQVKVAVFAIVIMCLLFGGVVSMFGATPRYSANMPKAYVEKVILNGYADVGLRESTGNNDGKHIDRYARSVGMPLRSAYCYAAIYTWCQDVSISTGLQNPLPRTGSTQTAFSITAARLPQAASAKPKRGDVLIWRIPRKWLGHAALITKATPEGVVYTIEANTSRADNGNQRDGGGIWTKRRFLNRGLGRLIVRGLIAIGS